MNTAQRLSPDIHHTAQATLPEIAYLGLRIEVVLERDWTEPLPGFAWRSLIGLLARQYFPEVFIALFDEANVQSRLWSFGAVQTEPGCTLELNINLFGVAASWGMEISKIVQLGAAQGIGRARTRYRVNRGWFAAGAGNPVLFMQAGVFQAWPMGRVLELDCSIRVSSPRLARLHICWLTPVLLKSQGAYLREAPALRLLVDRIATRMNHVSQAVRGCDLLVDPLRAQLQALAEQCDLMDATMRPVPLSRKSSRTGQVMRVDGLIGSVHYIGPVQPLLDVLEWARKLQLGSKTGLGCGAFEYRILE